MWRPPSHPGNGPSQHPEKALSQPPGPLPVPIAPRTVAHKHEHAMVGTSLVIKGEVTGSESLYIDGRVEGTIHLPENQVAIGRNAVVVANITAGEVVVSGDFKGNLCISDRLELRNSGSLTGEVVAKRVNIEDGAFFKGKIEMRKVASQPRVDANSGPTSGAPRPEGNHEPSD